MFLSQKIKDLRKENGLSQFDLSKKLNLPRTTIANWEQERCEPSIEDLKNIAKIFGVSVDYLIGFADDFGNVTVIDKAADLSQKEQELLIAFKRLTELEQDKLIEDAKFYAERHNVNTEEKIS